MNGVLIGLGVYVLLQLGIGVWVARRIKDEDDYLVAGRKLGLPMATMTVFATWFGAETCLGAAGRVYEGGLAGGSADPFGYAMCLVFMGVVFAMTLWRRQYTTIADLFRNRFGHDVEKLVVVLMVPSSLFWAAAQIRGFGQVLAIAGVGDVELAIAVATVVVIVYTGLGGLMADAVTDIVQGSVLIFGLLMLAIAVFGAGGADLTAVPAERLDFGAAAGSRWEIAELWAIPILGSVVAQELVSRTLASRSAHTARDATLLGAVIYLSIGLIPVSLGLVGPQLLPGLEHGDQVLPALAEKYLSPFLFVVFAGALVSAILSTVDSALLACSALVSHNVIGRMNPHLSERRKVVNARITVIAFGLVAYLLARESESVYALVEMASAFGSAGIVVAATFGLFTRIGGRWSAWAALVTGAAVFIIGGEIESLHAPYLLAIACSIAAYLLAAPFGRTHHEHAHHARSVDRDAHHGTDPAT